QRPVVAESSCWKTRNVARRTSNVQERFDSIVPRSEFGITERPGVLLARARGIREVVWGEARDGASPMIGKPARGKLFVQFGFGVPGHRQIRPTCQGGTNLGQGQTTNARSQAEQCATRARFE